MKLWVISGRYEESESDEVLHRVYEDGDRPCARDVIAEYLLDECDYREISEYACDCGDSDCEYCENPDSDAAQEFARGRALDSLSDCLYECSAWEVSNVDGYNIRVMEHADAKLRGVPSWEK